VIYHSKDYFGWYHYEPYLNKVIFAVVPMFSKI